MVIDSFIFFSFKSVLMMYAFSSRTRFHCVFFFFFPAFFCTTIPSLAVGEPVNYKFIQSGQTCIKYFLYAWPQAESPEQKSQPSWSLHSRKGDRE